MTKYLLTATLIAMLLFTYSCKKGNTTTTPGNTPVDALVGTYAGNVLYATEQFSFDSIAHYKYDTIDYGLNNITIAKVSSDSFTVAGTLDFIPKNIWGYSSSGTYLKGQQGGGSGTSDKLVFAAGTDSMQLISTNTVYDKYASFGHYTITVYFSGKKQ